MMTRAQLVHWAELNEGEVRRASGDAEAVARIAWVAGALLVAVILLGLA